MFLSCPHTVRNKGKNSFAENKIILDRGKNSPELYILNIKPDVYLFTAKEAGGLSKNNDGNTFDPHSVGNSLGKFWVPVSAEVLKPYLNVENSFVLLNQYPNQILSSHTRVFVATLGVSAVWFSHLSW